MRLTLLKKVDDAHDDSVWALAWIPGSNEIITGSVDETAKTWAEITDEEVPESEKKVLNNTHTFVSIFLYMGCLLNPYNAPEQTTINSDRLLS